MKTTTSRLIFLFLIGAVVYLANIFITPLVSSSITGTSFWATNFKSIVDNGKDALNFVASIFMLGGLVGFFTKELFSAAWDHFIKETITPFTDSTQKHLKDIGSEISTIREETEQLSNTFQKFLVDNRKPLSMDTCRTSGDFDKLLLPPCRELFGKHIDTPDSMFTYVRKVYLDAFSQAPHPSGVFKKISIENHSDLPEYVKWKEETRYKIHHVAYASKPETGRYLLRFSATSFAPDLEKEKWAESLQLKLRVNGENLLTHRDQPEFITEKTNEEGFFCKKEGNWVHLWFQKQIDLHDEWTEVVSEEISINSKLDRVYTLHTNKPTCQYTLDITVPKDLRFIKHPFITPKIAYSGLPDFLKRDLPKKTKVEHDSHNHARIQIEEWVMPGIVLNLNWIDHKEGM